jgi:hypothetical protein
MSQITYWAIKLKGTECYITRKDVHNFHHPEVFPPRLFNREQDCKSHS